MGGIQYVYWPGTTTRLTPWMLYCLQRLDADLRRLFDVHLSLDSSGTQRGIRTHEEQKDLFLSRYRVQWAGYGPFNDVRYWEGRRYVRHSGLGTVAQPGTSNHEIQEEYYAAIDLADSGGEGIGTMGSNRSNWLRANAGKYGLEPEGFKFKEAWHYRVPNIFQNVPGKPAGGGNTAPPTSEKDELTMTSPIWNVVEKVGSDPKSGKFFYGADSGAVFELAGYSRELVSIAFFGAQPGPDGKIPDLVPTVIKADFEKVKNLHRDMKTK